MSSTGEVVPFLFSFMEYWLIVEDIELALSVLRLDKMLSPEHEVSILVFVGLTKHPRDAPSFSISVQKNSTSSCATVEEMSSI